MLGKFLGGIDCAFVRLDALMRQSEARHGRHRSHLQTLEHLAQLATALVAAVPAIGDDHRGLARPFCEEVVDRVLERRRIAPIILRGDEHEGGGLRDLSAPGASMLEGIVVDRRDAGLVIHRKQPLLEVHDFKTCRYRFATDFRDPFSDLGRDALGSRATADDEDCVCVYHARIFVYGRGNVKVQNTRNMDRLGAALIDLIGFLNSPQRDEALLAEAGVNLDRALFPLLVALGARGGLGVAELAELVGRDHTTVSRQLSKLENLNLVERCDADIDRRRREAQPTEDGARIVRAIKVARRQLLSKALADWSEAERLALADNIGRFADALSAYSQKRR